jgi:hypothetical protein
MITIEVKVSGGKVPVRISLAVDSLGSHYVMIVKNKPFKESFNLGGGEHIISILGKNPEEGKTTITVSGENSNGQQIAKITKVKDGDHYSATIILNL